MCIFGSHFGSSARICQYSRWFSICGIPSNVMRALLPHGTRRTYLLPWGCLSIKPHKLRLLNPSLFEVLTWTTPPHVCCVSMRSPIVFFFVPLNRSSTKELSAKNYRTRLNPHIQSKSLPPRRDHTRFQFYS